MAALGDGVVAGKGALADNLADMNVEYKGVSFATGIFFYRVFMLVSFVDYVNQIMDLFTCV